MIWWSQLIYCNWMQMEQHTSEQWCDLLNFGWNNGWQHFYLRMQIQSFASVCIAMHCGAQYIHHWKKKSAGRQRDRDGNHAINGILFQTLEWVFFPTPLQIHLIVMYVNPLRNISCVHLLIKLRSIHFGEKFRIFRLSQRFLCIYYLPPRN